jgi:hypothetical protein
MSGRKSDGAEVWPAVNLTRDTRGMCVVSLRIEGRWVPVIRDNGDVISHFCEPSGIAAAVENQAGACTWPACACAREAGDACAMGFTVQHVGWDFPSGGDAGGGLTQCDMHEDESC